jgi:hypothetical protein
MPTHAIRGVVKSMSASALVVTPSRRRTRDMTFVLTPSTHREGEVIVGAIVSIRYRVTGGQVLVATAVSSHPETRQAIRR